MKKKEQIREIINTFDFDKVNSVMNFLNIQWPFNGEAPRVPTVAELKSVALLCLTKVASSEEDTATHNIYGFEAYKEGGAFQLSFILERTSPLFLILNSKKKDELGN